MEDCAETMDDSMVWRETNPPSAEGFWRTAPLSSRPRSSTRLPSPVCRDLCVTTRDGSITSVAI